MWNNGEQEESKKFRYIGGVKDRVNYPNHGINNTENMRLKLYQQIFKGFRLLWQDGREGYEIDLGKLV